MRKPLSILAIAALVILATRPPAGAQAWNIDARSVGMSGIGGDQNVFAQTIAEARGDHSIVLPLGLLQVWKDHNVFHPSKPEFDPARAVEYAANPLHLQFGRSGSSAGARFVYDVRNAQLQRNLSVYEGFTPASMRASGLVAPKYGHTFWLDDARSGKRQGIFVGAGPHLSLRTNLVSDDRLVQALDSGVNAAPNQRLTMRNATTAQFAAAITGGYRARFAASAEPGASPASAYLSVNVNYLRGIHYEDVDLGLQLQTGRDGTLTSTAGPALALTRQLATGGNGVSFDLGVGVTYKGFELGFSGNNLANRINWHGATRRPYALNSLFDGTGSLVKGPELQVGGVRIISPTDYRGNLGFRSRAFSVQTELTRASQKTWFNGGLELNFSRLQFRGAASLAREEWHPSAGLSVAMKRTLWLDLAGFETTANIERERRFGVATSLRWSPR